MQEENPTRRIEREILARGREKKILVTITKINEKHKIQWCRAQNFVCWSPFFSSNLNSWVIKRLTHYWKKNPKISSFFSSCQMCVCDRWNLLGLIRTRVKKNSHTMPRWIVEFQFFFSYCNYGNVTRDIHNNHLNSNCWTKLLDIQSDLCGKAFLTF